MVECRGADGFLKYCFFTGGYQTSSDWNELYLRHFRMFLVRHRPGRGRRTSWLGERICVPTGTAGCTRSTLIRCVVAIVCVSYLHMYIRKYLYIEIYTHVCPFASRAYFCQAFLEILYIVLVSQSRIFLYSGIPRYNNVGFDSSLCPRRYCHVFLMLYPSYCCHMLTLHILS